MKDKLTPKNIIFGLLICFLPLLMFAIDDLVALLSQYGIYLGWPGGEYMLRIIVRAGVYMMLAVGLNIVCGFTGLLDLGYVCFYLIGGYTAGILMARLGVSYWVALPLAVLHGTVWGVIARRAHFATYRRLLCYCYVWLRRTILPYCEKRTVVSWRAKRSVAWHSLAYTFWNHIQPKLAQLLPYSYLANLGCFYHLSTTAFACR